MKNIKNLLATPWFPFTKALVGMVEAMQSPMGEIWPMSRRLREIERRLDLMQMAIGRVEERQLSQASIPDAEFQVSSQWGEDGILQAILRRLPPIDHRFVEFGVETFVESNCRWLLRQHGWAGLVMDGSAENIAAIQQDPVYWQHNLKAVQAFVTAENIDSLISGNGMNGEIGILSIDVDGVDYWIWKEIHCVSPAVVVVEYNGIFGADRAVTVPYNPDFTRVKTNYSCLYYGASLGAFVALGNAKGYALVAANRAGNNAFFVRRNLLSNELREVSAQDVYIQRSFREGRGEDGNLAFLSFEEEQKLIADLPLEDVA
jgi:hypothetical protein